MTSIRRVSDDEAARLLVAHGYDPSLACWRQRTHGPFHSSDGKSWTGEIEIIGIERAAPLPDEVPVDGAALLSTDPPQTIYVDFVRVRIGVGRPLWVERVYPANSAPREVIHGIEHVQTKGEFDSLTNELWHALQIFRRIDRRGRPPRSEDPSNNWIKLTEKAIDIKRRKPRLSWAIIATAHIGVDPKTLHKWRKDYARMNHSQKPL